MSAMMQAKPQDSAGCDATKVYVVYFPGAGTEFVPDYRGNGGVLDSIHGFMNNSSVSIVNVEVTGYASIDNGFAENNDISYKRAKSLEEILSGIIPVQRGSIKTAYQGEDWRTLRSFIESDRSIPSRDRILGIIDSVPIFSGREKRIMELDGGNPYRMMAQLYFPELRRAEIKIGYRLKEVVHEASVLRDSVPDDLIIAENNVKECVQDTVEVVAAVAVNQATVQKTSVSKPFLTLALKTNLLKLAGVYTCDSPGSRLPNAAVEVLALGHWSVSGTAEYSNWSYDHSTQFNGVSGYGTELRYYPFDGYRWLYTGIYAVWGDFNNRSTSPERIACNDENYTGDYSRYGISLGSYLPLGPHFGVEAGIKAAYSHCSGYTYTVAPGHNYVRTHQSSSKIVLAEVTLNFVYRVDLRKKY